MLDPRARADADERSGQAVAQRGDRYIDMLRRQALLAIRAADMQVEFRRAYLDRAPTILDQRLRLTGKRGW